jgi:hypothetical protein
VPEAEFKGDKRPPKFYDAKEFVQRGETIAPFVRKENLVLKEQLDQQARELKELKENSARMDRMYSENMRRIKEQHDAELATVKAQKRDAVAAGDVKEFDRLEVKQAELEKKAPKDDAPPANNDAAPADLPAPAVKFMAENPWYGADEEMTEFAKIVSAKLAKDTPSITLEDNIAKTLDRVKKAFPEKFEGDKKPATPAPAANGHAAVDGGSAFPAARSKDSAFSKLSADAQAMAKKDVAAGLYKDVEAWAKVYNS